MEISERELTQIYEQKETEELLDLYRSGGLTELAVSVLASVLDSRSVNFDEVKTGIDAELLEQTQRERPENAQRTIHSSTTALYVIAALQILTSLAFQFYLGIAFGVVLAILASSVRASKSRDAALGVTILGGIASAFNFFGPIAIGGQFGNLVLSLIALWLGIRLMKACKFLAESIVRAKPSDGNA